MRIRTIIALLLIFVFRPSLGQHPTETDWGLIRQTLQTEKRTLVADNMNLVADEEKIFWDIYDQYEAEYSTVLKEKITILKDYLEKYHSISDEEAAKMMEKTFVLDRKSEKIREKYYKRIKKVMSVTHAVRFIQIERQLETFVKIMTYEETPLLDYK